MVRFVAIVLAAGLAAGVVSVASAAEFPAIDLARAEVGRRMDSWRQASEELESAKAEYDELGHRIAALKRLSAARGVREDAALTRLLQDSLDAGRRLEALSKDVDSKARSVRGGVAVAVAQIDTALRDERPGLTGGSLEDRAKTARRLKALVETRNSLRTALAELEPRSQSHAWAEYDVQVAPLDGPEELEGKADFLEDTRDRLDRKLHDLADLVGEARQAREIARAATDFRTDVRHFDEEIRTGRVTRQSTALSAQSGGVPGSAREAAPKSDQKVDQSPAPHAAAGVPGSGGAQEPDPGNTGQTRSYGAADTNPAEMATAPPDDTNAVGSRTAAPPTTADLPSGQSSGTAVGNTAAPRAPTGLTGGVPRQIDPSLLLNLRVHDLAHGTLSVEQLEELMSDLERLNRYLGARATTLRSRAKRMAEDEARALGIR